jgi:hypothetical protein
MPSDIDDYILDRINYYDRLTVRQLMRLKGWSDGTYPDVCARMRKLEKLDLVYHVELANQKGRGGVTNIYLLTSDGKNRAEDNDKRVRYKVIDHTEERSVDFWRHTLAVNDFLISAQVWKRTNPQVELQGMLTETDINKSRDFPVEVVLPSGEVVGYKPDGWLSGEITNRPFALSLEVERKKYSYPRWEEKLAKMVAFWESSEDADFLVFPVITQKGEDHRNQLLKWSAMILREMGKSHVARAIRITYANISEESIFTKPVWSMPGVYSLCGLLS